MIVGVGEVPRGALEGVQGVLLVAHGPNQIFVSLRQLFKPTLLPILSSAILGDFDDPFVERAIPAKSVQSLLDHSPLIALPELEHLVIDGALPAFKLGEATFLHINVLHVAFLLLLLLLGLFESCGVLCPSQCILESLLPSGVGLLLLLCLGNGRLQINA